jgi:hypothetical protein
MDEAVIPLKNAPPKTVPRKVLVITNFPVLKRVKKVIVVACCSASNVFILPFVMFREIYK